MTAFEIGRANALIGAAESALQAAEEDVRLPPTAAERVAFAQAAATLAVAWLQLDAARGIEVTATAPEQPPGDDVRRMLRQVLLLLDTKALRWIRDDAETRTITDRWRAAAAEGVTVDA